MSRINDKPILKLSRANYWEQIQASDLDDRDKNTLRGAMIAYLRHNGVFGASLDKGQTNDIIARIGLVEIDGQQLRLGIQQEGSTHVYLTMVDAD